MIIFEYKCENCLSVFDQVWSKDVACVSCGSRNVVQVTESFFSAGKNCSSHNRLNYSFNRSF